MSKRTIIFSDFYDTLATYAIQGKDERGMKEFTTLSLFLNHYLQENHFMYIISNAAGHTTIGDSAVMYNRIYNELDSTYQDHLFYYAIGNPTTEHEKTPLNFKVVTGSKEKIVEQIIEEQNITQEDVVIGAGDMGTDINMLCKISDIGGKSFYNIARYYEEAKQSDEHYIRSIAHKRARLLIEQKYGDSLSFELKSKLVDEKCLSIYNVLKSKYENGEFRSSELEQMYYYSMVSSFDYNSITNLRKKEEKYISEEELTRKLVLVENTEELYNQFYKFS